MVFEDSIGCTCEDAYVDMLRHKNSSTRGGGTGVSSHPELYKGRHHRSWHLIGQELAEQLLKGQFEVVITTHLNTCHCHYHNHLVFNSVSILDGHKYKQLQKDYYEEIRKISDGLCRKYRLSRYPVYRWEGMGYA